MITKEQLPEDLKTSFDNIAGQNTLAQLPTQPTQVPAAPTPFAPSIANASRGAVKMPVAAAPGSFGAKLGAALDATPLELQPDGKPQPGSWAKTLVGAAQKVLAGAGDISTTPTEQTNGFGGFVEGFAQTAGNQQQRKTKEAAVADAQKQQEVENTREQKKLDLQEQQTASQIASTNIQKMYTEQMMGNLKEETQLKDIARQKKDFDTVTKSDAPLEDVLFPRLTDTQLHDKVANHEIDLGKNKAYQIEKGVWAITTPGADRTVSKEQSEDIKKFTGQIISPGTIMPSTPFNVLMQTVHTNQTATDIRDEMRAKNAESGAKIQAGEEREEAVQLRPEFTQALAEAKSDPVKALSILEHKADVDPEFAKANPNLRKSFIDNFGGADLWNSELNRRTQLQIAREKEAADKAAKSKYVGNPAALQAGVEQQGPYKGLNMTYLQTLPQDDQGVVLQAATGRMNIQNLAYLLGRQPEFANAVANVSPQFDATRAQKFADLYKSFTSGPIAAARQSAGTTALHMKHLYELNNDPRAFIPGTRTHKERQTTITTLAEETAKFYKGGNAAPSKDEIEHFRDVFGTTNPYTANTAVTTQAGLMKNKIDEYDTQWDEAVPAPQYNGQKPQMSKKAQDSFEYLINDGVLPGNEGLPQGIPRGSVQIEHNGKKFWGGPPDTNGNRKNLGPVAETNNMPMGGGM